MVNLTVLGMQGLHERAVPYLQIRKTLVSRLVSTAGNLGLGQVRPILLALLWGPTLQVCDHRFGRMH